MRRYWKGWKSKSFKIIIKSWFATWTSNLGLLTEFCQKCDVFDKNFKISDVDLALKASKYTTNTINTAYGIVRHEFLEFLIRISLDKYFRSGIFKTEIEAVSFFFENNFSKFFNIYDQDKWRLERFYNQECEEIIIEYKDVFQILFDVHCGKKAKPGEKKYMKIEDFINFLSDIRCIPVFINKIKSAIVR